MISTSPVDSSFSSHPDDFGSAQDIQNLIETDLSESLLYCLNGNKPSDVSASELSPTSEPSSRISYLPNGSRKRNNCEIDGQMYFDEMHPKKMVVVGVPGETSL